MMKKAAGGNSDAVLWSRRSRRPAVVTLTSPGGREHAQGQGRQGGGKQGHSMLLKRAARAKGTGSRSGTRKGAPGPGSSLGQEKSWPLINAGCAPAAHGWGHRQPQVIRHANRIPGRNECALLAHRRCTGGPWVPSGRLRACQGRTSGRAGGPVEGGGGRGACRGCHEDVATALVVQAEAPRALRDAWAQQGAGATVSVRLRQCPHQR